jgi:DNA replication initiation complex subunit (GINS family)
MYSELYETWQKELQDPELVALPSDFYSRIARYLRVLREEGRMIDRRTLKASLVRREMRNVKRMIAELVQLRHGKIVRSIGTGAQIKLDVLTAEEQKLCANFPSFSEAFRSLSRDILRGSPPKMGTARQEHRRLVLRFLKDTPAIVGSDMKMYGPFQVEDVASLPVDNGRILVKQGLAVESEID